MIGMGGAILALQTAIRCSLESSLEFQKDKSSSSNSEPYFTSGFNARIEPETSYKNICSNISFGSYQNIGNSFDNFRYQNICSYKN